MHVWDVSVIYFTQLRANGCMCTAGPPLPVHRPGAADGIKFSNPMPTTDEEDAAEEEVGVSAACFADRQQHACCALLVPTESIVQNRR